MLPEFMYAKSYGDDGTFISLSTHPHRRPRPFQVGAREYLLCLECEARLNTHETYAAALLRSIDAIPYQGQQGVEVEYDYPSFKLFGISLLWRFHVSLLHEYRQVSLGLLAKDLRAMLMAGDPGPARMCPFGIVRYVGSGSAQRTIHTPVSLKWQEGQRVVFLAAFGYQWLFITSRQSHAIPDTMPLVGFTDKLVVPFHRTTDGEFIAWLQTKLRPEHGR